MEVIYLYGDMIGDKLAYKNLEEETFLICPVNCVKILGKGLALAMATQFPKYAVQHRKVTTSIGNVNIWFEHKIIDFPTKSHWRDPSKMSYIIDGLVDLKSQCNLLGIKSLAMPPIGCGLGGLNPILVKVEILKTFNDTDITLYMYNF